MFDVHRVEHIDLNRLLYCGEAEDTLWKKTMKEWGMLRGSTSWNAVSHLSEHVEIAYKCKG